MAGTLAIAKLSAHCIVADSPDSASIADRAIRALRDHFADGVRRAFSAWLDSSDDSVWVIRRLDLSVITATDAPTDVLAASVVRALGCALGESLSGVGDGANVIRFDNRAAYLASFLADASTGDAWSRWYYVPLSTLKLLPTSCAMRTAIARDPVTGLSALRRLDAKALANVVAALTSQDETLILDSLFASRADDVDDSADFDDAWAEYQRQSTAFLASPSLLVAFVQGSWDRKGRGFLNAMQQIRSALEAVRSAGERTRRQLVHSQGASGAGASIIGLPALAASVPARILREILVHAAVPRRTLLQERMSIDVTQYGGLLLLMRDAKALPWDDISEYWPQPQWPGGALRTLQWLTLATCAGRERSSAALHDDALRHLFGIPLAEPLRNIAHWLRKLGPHRCAQAAGALTATVAPPHPSGFDRREGISPAWSRTFALASRHVLMRFAHRLPGFADASPQYLQDNFLAGDASLDYEAERVIVHYSRPPLHLILMLTGMTRGLIAGRDVSGRPIIVFAKD